MAFFKYFFVTLLDSFEKLKQPNIDLNNIVLSYKEL